MFAGCGGNFLGCTAGTPGWLFPTGDVFVGCADPAHRGMGRIIENGPGEYVGLYAFAGDWLKIIIVLLTFGKIWGILSVVLYAPGAAIYA